MIEDTARQSLTASSENHGMVRLRMLLSRGMSSIIHWLRWQE